MKEKQGTQRDYAINPELLSAHFDFDSMTVKVFSWLFDLDNKPETTIDYSMNQEYRKNLITRTTKNPPSFHV